jgi:cystathionine beta-lyase
MSITSTELLQSIPSDPLTGAIAVPIYQTATFVQDAPGVNRGYDYSRTGNPTRAAAEALLATLEAGHTGVAFSSGLAAIDAVLKLLKSGDEIIATDDIYGGAFRLFTAVYEKFGITVKYVDATDTRNIIDAITDATRLIWIETPTNPLLKLTDIAAVAAIAKQHHLLLCVDNTFATPVLQQPLVLGADIVVHSATKYLGGHSDLIAGAVITKDPDLGARIKYLQNACGAILSPFDSWLLIRGIETLVLRVRQQNATALAIAQWLERQAGVRGVNFPGLNTHPQHALARTQSKGFGAIISFGLKSDSAAAAKAFVTSTRLFKLAESLGGVKSLLCHPATMTHASIPAERRRAAGVSDGLIRLSIGLEETSDLLADLEHALAAVAQHTRAQAAELV